MMLQSSQADAMSMQGSELNNARLSGNYAPPGVDDRDPESVEEWRNSTLREFLRDESEAEVGIRRHMSLARKKTRLKKRVQIYIYNFLERPTGRKCLAYHIAVFLVVLACLICSVLSTIEPGDQRTSDALLIMEYCVVVFFGVEYCVRLWSAGSVGKYSGFYGRLRFAKNPICLLDLFVVVASTVVLLFNKNGNVFATSAISVVYMHRQELITTLYIGFLALVLSSYFVYLAERPDEHASPTLQNRSNDANDLSLNSSSTNGSCLPAVSNSDFKNYADALWWGVFSLVMQVTVTTIGYGDLVPKTWLGKVVASFFSIFAISFFALPAGILGSGFALKVQQKQRQKQFNRQIPAAANLIQACWRCYATRRGSQCKATWQLYALPTRHRNDSTVSGTKLKPMKRDSQKAKRADLRGSNSKAITLSNWSDIIHEVRSCNDTKPLNLPNSYKNVVRALRVLIFLVRKKDFHQCRKPYDVRDVFEQYSHGYVNITVRLKELQRRLDMTLGKPASFNDDPLSGIDRQRVTAGFRLRRLELKMDGYGRQLQDCGRKLDEILSRMPAISQKEDSTCDR